MRVELVAFCSMQDKRTGKFLLDSHGAVRALDFIAGQLEGHRVRLWLPPSGQCQPSPILKRPYARATPFWQPTSNGDRRLCWDPAWLREIGDSDLVVSFHETLAAALRSLGCRARLATECGLSLPTQWPGSDWLIRASWARSDLLFCNSQELVDWCRRQAMPRAELWAFGHDERDCAPRGLPRSGVVFPGRCSVSGYAGHEMFLAAAGEGWTATDPTSYIRSVGGHPCVPEQPPNRDEYLALLHSSRVVCGLVSRGRAGFAFCEAVACGCVPVALRTPAYEEILGPDWPHYVDGDLRAAVEGAAGAAAPTDAVRQFSFQRAWEGMAREVLRD